MKKKTLSIFDGKVLHVVKKRLELLQQHKVRLSHDDITKMYHDKILSFEEAEQLHRLIGE